eukprot:m.75398 g.75398  ORF g.75398 m.75398 type:complete len:63 (+) comp11843_c0_seq11:170-358(+)
MKEHNVKFGLQLPDDVLAEEISFATEAIYIFPADQSSWIYLQWLLSAGELDTCCTFNHDNSF